MQLDMTKGRPLPVILKFTIPLIIGNVFQQLYNMHWLPLALPERSCSCSPAFPRELPPVFPY